MKLIKNGIKYFTKLVLISTIVHLSCHAMDRSKEIQVQHVIENKSCAAGILPYFVDNSETYVLLGYEIISYMSTPDKPVKFWTDFGGGSTKDEKGNRTEDFTITAAREFTEETLNIFNGGLGRDCTQIITQIASELKTLMQHPRHGYHCYLFRVNYFFEPQLFHIVRNQYLRKVEEAGITQQDLDLASLDKTKALEKKIEEILMPQGLFAQILEKQDFAWVNVRNLIEVIAPVQTKTLSELRSTQIRVNSKDGRQLLLLTNFVEILRTPESLHQLSTLINKR